MAKNEKRIALALLNLDYQTRAETDEGTGREYAELPADTFPPVVVYCIDDKYYLADGFHRVLAAKLRGENHIKAELRSGTVEDVILHGGTANNKQGKRPTRDDTQHFMRMVWERREAIFGGTPTGGNMAERCGVSANTGLAFVRERLAELPASPTQIAEVNGTQVTAPVRPSRLIGADGKSYPVRPVRAPLPKRPVRPAADADGDQPAAPTKAPQRPVYRDKNGGEHCVPLDRFDIEIPVPLQAAFDGVVRVKELASAISKVRCVIRDGLGDDVIKGKRGAVPNDLAFAAIRQDVIIQLDNAYNFVKSAQPFCVCRICQGQGCDACHGRGWQTEDEYEHTPKEFKATAVLNGAGADSDDGESEVQA